MYGDGEMSNNRLMPMKDLLSGKFDGEDARALGYFMYRFKMYTGGVTSKDQIPFFPNDIGCTLQDYSDAKQAWARDHIGSSDDILRLSKINLDNNDTGALTGSDAGYGPTKTAESILSETITADLWDEPESASSLIDGLTVYWPEQPLNDGLKIQTGTRANQNLTVFLPNMRAAALGVASADGTPISVATREKAVASLAILDAALGKALDTQTTIGAYQEELEYTEANLVTAHENVQSSESTIRDADMAKEMTDYTKANVLAQSAQAMLAQANQNAGNVISLLQ
jgi:flagellin-like hook-associated protein FlgL